MRHKSDNEALKKHTLCIYQLPHCLRVLAVSGERALQKYVAPRVYPLSYKFCKSPPICPGVEGEWGLTLIDTIAAMAHKYFTATGIS